MGPRKRKPQTSWWNVFGHVAGKLRDRDGRIQLVLYAGLFLLGFATFGIIDRTLFSPDEISPDNARFGWNEALAKQEAPAIAAEMPKFAITDADGNTVSGAGKNAELWKFARVANDGKHIATWRQESGDCVSMGASNAIAYRMAYQIAKEQRNQVLKIPFPPYLYGTSRVQIGKRQLGRGAGSIGAWAAKATQAYGVLPTEEANRLGFTYSGRLADQWGWNGPPDGAISYASKFRIRTVSQVKTWEDVRDALVHGYPVTVASNVGFNGGSYDRDGKRFLRPAGSWGHQMCFIGVEDRPGHTKSANCLNSWGADAHPKPIGDEPPGSFWVDAATVQRMVGQGDSWAYSDFDGFPAVDSGVDWNAFKLEAPPSEAAQVARAELPEPQPVLMETRKMFPLPFLYVAFALGALLFFGALFARYGNKHTGTIGALLIAATVLGAGDRAFAGRRHRLAMQQQAFSANCSCSTGICGPGQCAINQCVNGSCPTGYVPPAGKKSDPAAGLTAEMRAETKVSNPAEKPVASIEVASAEQVPASLFNAFDVKPDPIQQVWTAFPATSKSLRTYRDCYEHEADFVLVIGPETDALMTIETANKPVAHETALASVKPGAYRVYRDGLRMVMQPLGIAAKVTQKAKVKRLR